MTLLKNKKPFYAVKDCGIDIQVKDVDTSSRTVCYIANTFNFFDSQNDVLLPGCVDKSLTERGPLSNAPDKIVHAMFHNLNRLPGKIKLMEQRVIDGMTVIYGETKLSTSTEGNDALINYADGIYNQHSIGLQYVQGACEWISRDTPGDKWKKLLSQLINPETADQVGEAFVCSEIKLFENSTVTFGANKLTPTLGIKSEDKDLILMEYDSRLQQLLGAVKSGLQSDGMMKSFELQILQLRQAAADMVEHFGTKSIKDKTENVIQPIDWSKVSLV